MFFPDVSEHDVSVLRFQLNESITLNCSFTDMHDMAWYHQNPESGRLTILIFARSIGTKLFTDYQNSRLTITADMLTKTASLVITGLIQSDSGLYFCGTRSVNSDMRFGNPIRIQIEEKLTDSEDEAHSDAEITDGLTLMERVLIFGGVGLAVFVFFLVIIIAGRNIYYHGWQKGWTAAEYAGLSDQKSPK
ncbi:uncharacterized protein LOC131526017 isoform X2 [Onychostoma macrolepis]|uniref:uncharacterized protein LOC131526017 isoform X2 n=1 Tax=Onychostoma macrolepis TaxID=369639 RepID=UPI002729EA07|nr:uncharacterized protein LOC131526017 isoform X2 [Onychostoma macrolepis]